MEIKIERKNKIPKTKGTPKIYDGFKGDENIFENMEVIPEDMEEENISGNKEEKMELEEVENKED